MHRIMRTVMNFGVGFILGVLMCIFSYESKDIALGYVKTVKENLLLRITHDSGITETVPDHQESGDLRVFCYLLIGPNTKDAALHVKRTWGKRCDKFVMFSTEQDEALDILKLNVTEGYMHLWDKSKEALNYIYKNHLNYDWYLKADHDTYTILENLKLFLSSKFSSDPVYYGVKFKAFVKQGYMSGGGGYVLSKEAVRRFGGIQAKYVSEEECPISATTGAEDLNLGKCLQAVGVMAGSSLDREGKPRFFCHSPVALYFETPLVNYFHWYWSYLWYKHNLGVGCCSEYSITFHQIDPRMMWALEGLLYHLKIHEK